MADNASEDVLSGGNMTEVTRVGDEVRRPAGSWTNNVHELLIVLRDAGITEVPRVLGLTVDGRERLSFVPGTVAHYPLPDWIWDETALVDAASLLRRLHGASIPLLGGNPAGWRHPPREPVEVICHNDFAPYNLVFNEKRRLVGVIDFDTASPGPRIWDLAYLAYRIVPFTEEEDVPPRIRDAQAARLGILLRAYGSDAAPDELLSVMADRLDALAAHSRAHSAQNPELLLHAEMYERDARRLRARLD